MTPSCMSHARRAVPMCCSRPQIIERTPSVLATLPTSDNPNGPQQTTRRCCCHLLAALIVACDSLCVNSMALGGRAGNDSSKQGGVAGRLV